MNRVYLLGRLGHNPQLRYMTTGKAVVSFSVATTERWTDSNGEKHEHTEWHTCIAFGRQGEIINEYFSKGSEILLVGRLRSEKYTPKGSTEERRVVKVYVEEFEFTGGSRRDKTTTEAPPPVTTDESTGGDAENDLPF